MSSTEKTPTDLATLYGERQSASGGDRSPRRALAHHRKPARPVVRRARRVRHSGGDRGRRRLFRQRSRWRRSPRSPPSSCGTARWSAASRPPRARPRSTVTHVLRVSGRFRELPDDGAIFQRAEAPVRLRHRSLRYASLFQRLGVARTTFGQRMLSGWLKSTTPPAPEVLKLRQEAVTELSQNLELRQGVRVASARRDRARALGRGRQRAFCESPRTPRRSCTGRRASPRSPRSRCSWWRRARSRRSRSRRGSPTCTGSRRSRSWCS